MRVTHAWCLVFGISALACTIGCDDAGLSSLLTDLGLTVDVIINTNDNGSGGNNNNDNGGNNNGGNDGNNNGNDGNNNGNGGNNNGGNDGNNNDNGNGNDGNNNNNGNDGNNNDNGGNNNGGNDGNDNGNDNSGGLIGNPTAGSVVYTEQNCGSCHGEDGSGPPNILGEGLFSLTQRARNGQNHSGGAFPDLTDQDLANLEAFLGS